MKRRTRELLATGAALPLLFGCAEQGDQPGQVVDPRATGTYSTKLYPSQQKHIRTNFERDVAYWKSHSVGKIAATKLVILSGNQAKFDCPLGKDKGTAHYKANSMSNFCATKNTVVFTGITLDIELTEGVGQKSADYALDHLVGSAVQYAKGDLKPEMLFDEKRLGKLQTQAACFAGIIANEFEPRSIKPVHDYLAKLDHSAHPTTQAPAYMQGATTGNCGSLL